MRKVGITNFGESLSLPLLQSKTIQAFFCNCEIFARQHQTQVNPNVLRFLACPWVTVGTGKLQICVGIGRNHRTAPRPRSKAIKAIFVAFISIFESKHA